MALTDGHRLLRRWLDKTKTSQTALARGIGRSDPSVSLWFSGSTPDLISAVAIETFTDGAVPVEAWARKRRGSAA